MSTIFLTGFMGTGKSSVGKVLAERLGYDFVDLDSCIVEKEGCSIREIFSKQGEAYFRKIEREQLLCLLEREFLVVSTGGGIAIDPENRLDMRRCGIVINLVAEPEILLNRLKEETERPLLHGAKSVEMIRKMISEREHGYADADIRIDTSGKNVEDVVREILVYVESRL